MGNELLALYYYNHNKYYVYGCWDEETPENKIEFYDLYELPFGEDNLICINEGEPFYTLPTRDEVIEFINQ